MSSVSSPSSPPAPADRPEEAAAAAAPATAPPEGAAEAGCGRWPSCRLCRTMRATRGSAESRSIGSDTRPTCRSGRVREPGGRAGFRCSRCWGSFLRLANRRAGQYGRGHVVRQCRRLGARKDVAGTRWGWAEVGWCIPCPASRAQPPRTAGPIARPACTPPPTHQLRQHKRRQGLGNCHGPGARAGPLLIALGGRGGGRAGCSCQQLLQQLQGGQAGQGVGAVRQLPLQRLQRAAVPQQLQPVHRLARRCCCGCGCGVG